MNQSEIKTTKMTFEGALELADHNVGVLMDKVRVGEEIQPAVVFSGKLSQFAFDKITHIAHVLRDQSGSIDMATLEIFDKAQRIIRLECELAGYKLE